MSKPDYLRVGHESYVRVHCKKCDDVKLHLTKIYQIKGMRVSFNKVCVKCYEDNEALKGLGLEQTLEWDWERVTLSTWVWLQVDDKD